MPAQAGCVEGGFVRHGRLAPLDYERWAVPVSPLLAPGAAYVEAKPPPLINLLVISCANTEPAPFDGNVFQIRGSGAH